MSITEAFMQVFVNGKSEMRAVSHREDATWSPLGNASSALPLHLREVPVLRDGEKCIHTIDGRCHIYKAEWPDPGSMSSLGNREEVFGEKDDL